MSARLPISASADNLMPHDLPEARIAAADCTETTRSVLPDTQSALHALAPSADGKSTVGRVSAVACAYGRDAFAPWSQNTRQALCHPGLPRQEHKVSTRHFDKSGIAFSSQ